METRYRVVTGCIGCGWRNDRVEVVGCCPKCGGTFMEHKIRHDIKIHEKFVKQKAVWWRPSTWSGRWVEID